MKTNDKVKMLLLGTSFFTFAANASVELDINSKMTKMLGHPAAVTNIFDASTTQNLDNGKTPFQPWSGSFWPDLSGGIADHYRLHSVIGTEARFVLGYGISKIRFQSDAKDTLANYSTWTEDDINQHLAPSEKYDLLLGDTSFTFTKNIMDELDFRSKYRMQTRRAGGGNGNVDDNLEGYNNNYMYEDDDKTYTPYTGDIQYSFWADRKAKLVTWSGICDGWSPAANYLPRPIQPVTVTGALGNRITFYPDDLKALGSYLFARTNTPFFTSMNYQFAGKSCTASGGGKPGRDDHGYVLDARCNDLDAGVWHLTLLNRIGKDGMGFMMDVDNNHKINNHPVKSYQLTYFNPATGEEGALKDSMIGKNEIADGYAKRRNPKTVYLVGVKSTVQYLFYLLPEADNDVTSDSDSHDKVKELTFTYDLELDAQGNILGGEWGDRSQDASDGSKVSYGDQPDFIWMAAPQNLAYSRMSVFTNSGTKIDQSVARPFGNMQWAWDGQSALPDDWMRAAKKDEMWSPPSVVNLGGADYQTVDVPMEARNAALNSAEPLSQIVYYLFDQARDPAQK